MKPVLIISYVLLAITMAEDDQNAYQLFRKGNINFTRLFTKEVVKSKPDKSVVMSANSVLTPLAQLSLATVGDSQQELLAALGLPNTDVVKDAFKKAEKDIRSVQGVTLKTASKIYVGLGTKLKNDFNAVSKDVFDTDVENVNFGTPVPTAAAINEWVESQTNNRIKNLVSPDFLEGAQALLVNAIYFKGKWLNPFSTALTSNKDFYVTKDKKMEVPMMFQKRKFLYGYSKELKAKLIEIPYEKSEASFIVILPDEVDGLSDLEAKLSVPNALTKANQEMTYQEVLLHLPKFKIETTIDLKDILKQIGVEKIFIPGQAKLTNLLETDQNAYISNAIQKAFIEVTEEGAEAGAANAFGVAFASALIELEPPKDFNANHPFAFAIKVHDNILFTGVLVE